MIKSEPIVRNNKNRSPIALFKQKQYEANKSAVAILMGHFFLRYLNRLYHEFEGDLILPMVLGEIAHHNIVKFYSRNGSCIDVRDKLDNGQLEKLEPCNAFSISEATGIPRETVRRKIDTLVRKGWIVKNSRAEATISETVGDHFMKDFNKTLLTELLESSECIKRLLESEQEACPI